uniref:Uncharacterized protein n=1 Tax=Anguilla anguilla TaxID=7936 RepID=A0A0E9XVF3_ANGAN
MHFQHIKEKHTVRQRWRLPARVHEVKQFHLSSTCHKDPSHNSGIGTLFGSSPLAGRVHMKGT